VKRGRPVSQHLEFGGPFDVAESGDELRAPGGTVFVTAAIGAGGGEDGADETLLCKDTNEKLRLEQKKLLFELCFFFFRF
jgi:hypothetical protein